METKHKITNIELRSEEVQELMGRIPPVILRVGITVILVFAILIIIASNFIKYPDTISVPIVINNVNILTEVKTEKTGQIIDFRKVRCHVDKGDTLAKIVAEDVNDIDTTYICSPFTGIVYPCDLFQEKDYVYKGEDLFFVVDSIRKKIIAKASIPITLKKKIKIGMPVESSINNIALLGRVTLIAEYANPNNGTYVVTLEFETPRELTNFVVWNFHTVGKLKITEQTVFKRFFANKIIHF